MTIDSTQPGICTADGGPACPGHTPNCEPGRAQPAAADSTGRPPRAPDPALVDGQRVLIEAEVCARGTRIHTIRPQQSGTIVYLDLAEVVVHRDLPVQAVMDRIDVTAAETMRRVDTIAAALNAGASGWSQAMAAENARLRSQLAEACQQRDQAAAALVRAETERDGARLECATLEQDMDETEQCLDETEQQNAGLRAERDEAQDRLRTLRHRIDELVSYMGAWTTSTWADKQDYVYDTLTRALAATAPETAPESPHTADPAPEQAEASTEHLGDAEGAVAYWRTEISEILAAWLTEEQRTGWQRLASDVAEQIIRDLDIADMAAERDRLRTERDRLRRRLGDVLDLEELPEDHTADTNLYLRAWLAERRIPDCDCGYAWVHSPNEAYARTGRIPDGEYPRDYPRWVRTTVDERCPCHGSRRAGSTPDTGSTDEPA